MYKYIEPHTPVPGKFLRRRSGFGYVSLFLCPLIFVGYLYVYMKLIDIISEDEELDEGFKSDEQWLDELKRKFPDWDYSNAIIYSDGRRKKIKNE